jgi:hypothetical protein
MGLRLYERATEVVLGQVIVAGNQVMGRDVDVRPRGQGHPL